MSDDTTPAEKYISSGGVIPEAFDGDDGLRNIFSVVSMICDHHVYSAKIEGSTMNVGNPHSKDRPYFFLERTGESRVRFGHAVTEFYGYGRDWGDICTRIFDMIGDEKFDGRINSSS